jgi:uncharacterized protein VirK/YbjX
MFDTLHLIGRYARLVYRHTQDPLRWLRFCLRSAIKNRATMTWLRYIESTPFLAQAPEAVRRVLADKIHKPFARCHLTTTQRVDALITHYDVLAHLFPRSVLEKIVEGRRLVIATLDGLHSPETYTITLSREMLSQHQGELAFLMLDMQSEVPLARLVVNLNRNRDGDIQLVLNGMQGPGPEYKKRIVEVTRNLDGLRPKRAVVEVATAFAQAISAGGIIAIGKKNHVSQSKAKWQRRNRTDYDSYWEEFDVTPLANGDYQFPMNIERRNPEDIPSKKRKQAMSRYALLKTLHYETLKAFVSLRNEQGATLLPIKDPMIQKSA